MFVDATAFAPIKTHTLPPFSSAAAYWKHLPALFGEARLPLELAALLSADIWNTPPEGAGRPVLPICGFMAGDTSMDLLASWLRRGGWQPDRAGITWNVDCSEAETARLERRLERQVDRAGQRALIIGHSRGGLFGRVLAVRRPDLVAGLVTLGSPTLDPIQADRPLLQSSLAFVAGLAGFGLPRTMHRSCLQDDSPCGCGQFGRDLAAPFPSDVGFIAAYSDQDGIVDWRDCCDPAARCYDVGGSHCGMAISTAVYQLLADQLPQLLAA